MKLYNYDEGEGRLSPPEEGCEPTYEAVYAALSGLNRLGTTAIGPFLPRAEHDDLIVFPCVYSGAHDDDVSFLLLFADREVSEEEVVALGYNLRDGEEYGGDEYECDSEEG